MSNNGVPEIADELNRKSMYTLSEVLRRHEQGIYSDAEAKACAHTIFDITSGLVSRDVMDLISEFVEYIENN